MKDTRFWRIALFFGILCFCLCSAQPILASETTEEDGDWIYICYLVDDCPTVKMKPGYAMSNLWEPETVHGAKFLYWTTMRTDPMNEQYKVTKETVFYETTFLSAVTVNTEKELEESMKFAQEWDAGQGTQQETEAARDRYTVVFHLENGEDDWVYYYDKPTVVGKERYDRFVSEIEEKKGYHFVGFYTKPNGKGRKMTPKTKIKSDMEYYAFWEENTYYKVTFLQNYGKEDTPVKEINVSKENPVMKKMPAIARKKYQFLGWYTAAKNGKRVKVGMQLTGDITLYAHWSKIMVPRASIRKLYNSKNCVILKYKKNKKATGYQMQISTSKNYAGKATSTKTYKTNKIFVRRISGLKSGKTYYFRVRAYKKDSVGCLVKGKWSKSKKITVK